MLTFRKKWAGVRWATLVHYKGEISCLDLDCVIQKSVSPPLCFYFLYPVPSSSYIYTYLLLVRSECTDRLSPTPSWARLPPIFLRIHDLPPPTLDEDYKRCVVQRERELIPKSPMVSVWTVGKAFPPVAATLASGHLVLYEKYWSLADFDWK